jgi:hypothetical protein
MCTQTTTLFLSSTLVTENYHHSERDATYYISSIVGNPNVKEASHEQSRIIRAFTLILAWAHRK